nr:hypothetical protein [Tanacetum cinerariifolium]
MVISITLVSSDSSEESVGTPAGRVILFGSIPTHIPDTTLIPVKIPTVSPIITPSLDYTPASPDYSPISDTETDLSEDPSSDHIPPLPATSPFLSSTDDSSDSDTPDTPPSRTHGTPFTDITLSTQSSPAASGALRRRVMIRAPRQPIPYGRPYCYHPNGPVHMMTARKRVGPLPTHRLAVRHSVDYSSSDHFTLDDSSRDSSSGSSSETSLDSPSDDLSDSSSSHSSSNHLLPAQPSGNDLTAYTMRFQELVLLCTIMVPDEEDKISSCGVLLCYRTMTNIRSGATMIREVVNELIEHRVAEALEARDAARNLKPLVEGGGEQEDERGNGNGGNGNERVNGNGGLNGNRGGNNNKNGNGHEGGNGHNFEGLMLVARECTYQDFLKCQPLNSNGTKRSCWVGSLVREDGDGVPH